MFQAKLFSKPIFYFLVICGILILPTKIVSQTTKSNLSLTLKRTGCLGRCPIYELKIQSNGNVVFEGIQNTQVKGTAKSNLSKEKISQIIAEINKAKFFSLKNSYAKGSENCPSLITDSSTVTISIELNRKRKTVTHYLGCIQNVNGDPFEF